MDVFIASLFQVLAWPTAGFLLLGVAIGFVVGILPGLGGAVTLALMLPFIYDMDPIPAFAFLLGMHAVVATTGDITSVLFGIPGEATAVVVRTGKQTETRSAMDTNGEAHPETGVEVRLQLAGAEAGQPADGLVNFFFRTIFTLCFLNVEWVYICKLHRENSMVRLVVHC